MYDLGKSNSHWSTPLLHHGFGLPSRQVNACISVALALRVWIAEFSNSLAMLSTYLRVSTADGTQCAVPVVYLVCLRYSVFSRRRVDVLSANLPVLSDFLQRLQSSISEFSKAELHVFKMIGCNVWVASLNIHELVGHTLENVSALRSRPAGFSILLDICVKIGTLFLFDECLSKHFALGCSWYRGMATYHIMSSRTTRALACVVTGIGILSGECIEKVTRRVGEVNRLSDSLKEVTELSKNLFILISGSVAY